MKVCWFKWGEFIKFSWLRGKSKLDFVLLLLLRTSGTGLCRISFCLIGWKLVLFDKLFPIHRYFQSETIRDLELIPADHPPCIEFALVNLEPAFFKIEHRCDCRYDFRKETSFSPGQETLVGCFMAAIHKRIGCTIMPMQVTEDLYAIREFARLLHLTLEEINLRMYNRVRLCPPSIQIQPYNRCAGIPNDHTVRVEHGYQFYDVILQEGFVFIVRPFFVGAKFL